MLSIKKYYKNSRLSHKLLLIFLCAGTVPMLVLGGFVYQQQRRALLQNERTTISSALSQGTEHLDSELLTYQNLSDYIAFNSPISKALDGEYASVYEKYKQYAENVDPVLSSFSYFNSNITQLTVYVAGETVRHDSTVAPLREIKQESWYQEGSLSQNISWHIDADERKAFCVRTMPIMEQDGKKGILYLEVTYDALFSGLDQITQKQYGICVFDKEGNAVYQSSHFDTQKYVLSAKSLYRAYQDTEKQKNSDDMILSDQADATGWQIVLYRPKALIYDSAKNLIVLVAGLIAVCALSTVLAVIAFSRFVVRDIVRLQKNMEQVEKGDMTFSVSSDSEDEIGNLIRGFGSMIARINYLIHEVYEGKLRQRQYEMQALQAQINPHFLYNSLSLINWKALEAGKEDISKLTLALSSFYRTSLNRGNNVLTIEKEIENMQSYLEIQSCMHDNSFDVVTDIDESILQCETLNLLLQPLVENAIEHGVDLLEDRRGYIKIIGRRQADTIQMTVEDNGVGMDQKTLETILEIQTRGYGVRNVNERIKLFYGGEYQLHIESGQNVGTRCTITIPIRKTT